MEIDKTTLNDLSIFNNDDEFSILDKLNFTQTSRGKEQLRKDLSTPLSSLNAIIEVQSAIRHIMNSLPNWPKRVTNGTIMVVERFFESTLDPLPEHVTSLTSFTYKLLHGPDYSLAKYVFTHSLDFIQGILVLKDLLLNVDTPEVLRKPLYEAGRIIDHSKLKVMEGKKEVADFSIQEQLELAYYIRYHFKNQVGELLYIYGRLDAWYGMAAAVKELGLVFPEFRPTDHPYIETNGLYHILLEKPVAYDLLLDQEKNFLFLTGANMAGKSTFIKSVGTAVFLAHIGMGVPANLFRLSFFDGMLSNINVVDNIVKGESYFFNEVQRIKATINKISDGRKWLILIDELFKGTNVQDAMKCSQSVIEGLLKIRNSLFILSTHLYEIGEVLKQHTRISFYYFETTVTGEQLNFNYQLRPGISNDRLGYLILKQEGVVKMLQQL